MSERICFAHEHMTCRQYGLWSRIRELQNKREFVFFDADYLSEHFQSTSRDVIYDDCKALLSAGWFELLGERRRKKDGTWESRKIRALSHREWSDRHPGKCENLHAGQSANSDDPVGKQRRTSRLIATNQSLPANKDFVLTDRHDSKSDIIPDQTSFGTTPNTTAGGLEGKENYAPSPIPTPADNASTLAPALGGPANSAPIPSDAWTGWGQQVIP